MDKRKRGPYRQYLRQDEPFKSQSYRRKIKRRASKSLLGTTYESDGEVSDFQDETAGDKGLQKKDEFVQLDDLETWQDLQEIEEGFYSTDLESCLSMTESIDDLNSYNSDNSWDSVESEI